MRLTGQVALVTGSSRGIGRGIALAFADEGADVVVNYLRSKREAGEVAKAIQAKGRKSVAIKANVRDPKAVRRLINDVVKHFGRLDILVNNVGDFIMKPLSEMTLDDWHTVLDSNLNATFYGCKYALEVMRKQRSGCILNIGVAPAESAVGGRAFQQVAAYTIAKTGVLILTKSLAREEMKNGIRVNSVSPGLIDNGTLSEEERNDMAKMVPAGRVGLPADVAKAVVFLASDDAAYITGENIIVSGGWGI